MAWEPFDVAPLVPGEAWLVVDRGTGERAVVRRLRPPPEGQPPTRRRRWPWAVGLVVVVAAVALRPHPDGPASTARPLAPAADWRATVAWLESARLAALGRADAAALRQVYAPGAPGLAADLATVARLRAGGLHAVGAVVRVLSARVRSAAPGRVVLDVVDVLGGYAIADSGGRVTHRQPPRAPRPERVVLARAADGGWRLAEVRAA